MRRVPLFVAGIAWLCLISVQASGAIYRCEQGGKTVFSDRPCGDEAVDITSSVASRASVKGNPTTLKWQFYKHQDEMTGENTCLITTKAFTVDLQRGRLSEIKTGDLRIGMTRGLTAPNVVIRSGDFFDHRAHSFHNDISGLGIRVGDGEFFPVEKKAGNYLLAFGDSASGQIVEQLKSGAPFRVRVRFWPYETTFDSNPIAPDGFDDSYKQLVECSKSI